MGARACVAPDTVLIRTAAGGSLTGKIRNLSNGVVHVLLPEVIPEGSLVQVEISTRCAVSGEVMYSSPYQTSFNTAIYFESDGNRRFRAMPRFNLHEAAMVAVMNCPSHTLVQAHVTDASKMGLGLVLDQPLLTNEWVKVETRSCVVFGDIVYCMPHTAGGYRTGLAIETVIFRFEGESNGDRQWIFNTAGPHRKDSALATLLAVLGWHRAQ
jgi:hypothetical protein